MQYVKLSNRQYYHIQHKAGLKNRGFTSVPELKDNTMLWQMFEHDPLPARRR